MQNNCSNAQWKFPQPVFANMACLRLCWIVWFITNSLQYKETEYVFAHLAALSLLTKEPKNLTY